VDDGVPASWPGNESPEPSLLDVRAVHFGQLRKLPCVNPRKFHGRLGGTEQHLQPTEQSLCEQRLSRRSSGSRPVCTPSASASTPRFRNDPGDQTECGYNALFSTYGTLTPYHGCVWLYRVVVDDGRLTVIARRDHDRAGWRVLIGAFEAGRTPRNGRRSRCQTGFGRCGGHCGRKGCCRPPARRVR
jgi:hypothetical protein